MAITSFFFKAKINNSKNQIEEIYTQEEKIFKFYDNVCKIIAKIRKICINTIQTDFLLIKTLSKQTSKNL